MSKQKELMNRITMLNLENTDEVIFDTYDIYELKNVAFTDSSIVVGSEIIINEIKYMVRELTIDVLLSESKILKNNLQTFIYISKII